MKALTRDIRAWPQAEACFCLG